MGLFSKSARVDPEEMADVRAELAEMRGRLAASEKSKTLLEAHVIQLDAATNALAARAHMIDDVTLRLAEVDVLKRQVAQIDVVNAKIASLDGLNGKLAELAEKVSHTSSDAKDASNDAKAASDEAKAATEQAASLHERISNVSTELANQLGELSREIDGLASQAAKTPTLQTEQMVSPDVLDRLKSAQIRLANEQARYEIAFRHDLASLAEQVQRAQHNGHPKTD